MEKKLTYFSAIKYLSKYIKKHKRNFIMFYFGWFFDLILSVSMPILFGVMIDEIVYLQNVDTFIQVSLLFVIMSIFSCILYFFIYAQHHYLMSMYTYDIKKDLFEHLQKTDAKDMADAKTGDIVSIIQHYSGECMHFVIRNFIHLINGIIRLTAITAYLFIISWEIGLFVIIAAPITVFANIQFGKKIRNYSDNQRDNYGEYISWVYEILSGLRDIRMMGAQKKTNRIFKDNHKKMFDVNIKSSVSTLTATNIIGFVNLATQLTIFTFAGYLALSGNITIGLLLVIVTFFTMLTGQIKMTSSSFLDAQNRVSFIQKIKDFMDSKTEDERNDKSDLNITKGEISFKNIDFSYVDGVKILENFNLKIGEGERFAVVGKSGSGKTTLAYMLIGFYHQQKGDIFIDGQKLSECSLKSIRENIGLIAQDVLIFDGTIKENITLGNKNVSDDEIVSAYKQAGLWDFIENLPEKIDTVIGKSGIGISGGQKQRIAIARIYLKNPKIIIFDEATSALDSETEQTIHEAWQKVLSGRTSVVIAHRLSSVMLCEKVAIVMVK